MEETTNERYIRALSIIQNKTAECTMQLREELERSNQSEPEGVKLQSDKAYRIKNIIEKANFGCKEQAVAQLMSVLLDEEIKIDDNTEKENDNNLVIKYRDILPRCLIYNKRRGLVYCERVDGHDDIQGLDIKGNCIDMRNYSDKQFRPATGDEIKQYFDVLRQLISVIGLNALDNANDYDIEEDEYGMHDWLEELV